MVDVMEYATNKNKTEQRFFVTGVNCDPTTARDEMMITKADGATRVRLSAITASRASSTVRLRQSRLTKSVLNLPSECGAIDFKSSLPPT